MTNSKKYFALLRPPHATSALPGTPHLFVAILGILFFGSLIASPSAAGQSEEDAYPALSEVKQRANEGDAFCEALLAAWYSRAQKGLETDYRLAFTLATRSAAKGNCLGQFYAAKFHFLGVGTKRDHEEGKKYMRESVEALTRLAAQGDPEAQCAVAFICASKELGVQMENNPEQARRWWDKAVDQDYAPAMVQLGTYLMTTDGIPGDRDRIEELFRNAAKKGYPPGLSSLAFLLQMTSRADDYDVSKAKSFEYQLQAAKRGFAQAVLRVARDYENGDGVNRDITEAAKYYRRGMTYDVTKRKCTEGYERCLRIVEQEGILVGDN